MESFLLPTKNLEEIQDVNLRKFDLHPPQPEKVSESLGGNGTCFFLFSSEVIWMVNKKIKEFGKVGFIT